MMDQLIPGLPDEITRECLIRVPYDAFRTVRSVCKLWRGEIDSSEFHSQRKLAGLTRPVVAFTQSEAVPVTAGGCTAAQKYSFAPSYRLTLFEPDAGVWQTLPAVPWLPHGLPLFCRLAGAGRELVVVGGWDPETWIASDEVSVYDLVSGNWRRGARMPGPRRSFFACAASSDPDRTVVFVAGGHDEDKNALKSALAYDVATDRWVPLPDMAAERDECKGVFHDGVFHVIGGYSTEMQGRFGKSGESFDPATWQWGPVDEDTLEAGTCPRTCAACDDGKLYRCRAGHVAKAAERGWRAVAELPGDARVAPHAVTWRGKLLVMGSSCHGGPLVGHVLEATAAAGDGKVGHRWKRVVVPEEYSGQVQASCCLVI